MSGRYDPEVAAASLEALAAITAEQETADIRTAAVATLDAIDAWRASTRWRGGPYAEQLVRLAGRVRTALDELPADAGLDDVADTVTPLLGEAWSDQLVNDAIDQLREYAMRRRSLCHDARRLTGRQDERDRRSGGLV